VKGIPLRENLLRPPVEVEKEKEEGDRKEDRGGERVLRVERGDRRDEEE